MFGKRSIQGGGTGTKPPSGSSVIASEPQSRNAVSVSAPSAAAVATSEPVRSYAKESEPAPVADVNLKSEEFYRKKGLIFGALIEAGGSKSSTKILDVVRIRNQVTFFVLNLSLKVLS